MFMFTFMLSRVSMQLEGSITSDFPSLLALNNMRSGKYDGVSTPPELSEKPKYLATAQYKNGTVVSGSSIPLQYRTMGLQCSSRAGASTHQVKLPRRVVVVIGTAIDKNRV